MDSMKPARAEPPGEIEGFGFFVSLLLGELKMVRSRRALGGVLAAGLLLGTGLVQAALSEPVDGMVYDDVLDLCWLQDVGTSGPRNWGDAVAWAEDLVFGGHTDWRLARMSSTSPTQSITFCTSTNEEACRTSGNELGYMFFHNLTGDFPKTGNQGPFTDIPEFIWSGTEFSAVFAWFFVANGGGQLFVDKDLQLFGWAVRPGQCRAAPGRPEPIPAVGAWGLGVLGLLLMLLARARLR